MHRIDQSVLQSLTALVIILAINDEQISVAISRWFWGAEVIIPVSAFLFVYRAMVFIYNKVFWKLIHRENYIGGYWVYRLENHKTGDNLYGIFKVLQGIEGALVRYGEVWYSGTPPISKNQRGTWKSLSATVTESELQFLFKMRTLAKEDRAGTGKEVQGVFILNLIEDNNHISIMSGHFNDHNERASSLGTIEAKKVSSMSRDQLKELAYKEYGNEQSPTNDKLNEQAEQ